MQSGETRFEAKVNDLEGRIVDLIDRSSNDLRVKQGLEEKMEAELEVRKHSLEIEFEQRMQANEVRWQGERRRMTVEIESLKKKLTVRKPVAPPSMIDKLFFRAQRP